MYKIVQFEIYFEDLTEAAQHYLCECFETTLEEENWEVLPLTAIEREIEEAEKEKD